MKRIMICGSLVAAMLAGAAAPSFAQERHPPHTARGDQDGAYGKRHGKEGGDNHKGGPRFGQDGPGNPGLKLAERLSGLETYIGITPEQAPAWRGYTEALLAFAEADRPGHGPGQEAGPQGPKETGKPPAPPRLMAEMMARRAIAQGERAEKLEAAAATLRTSLSEAQLARLIGAEAPPKGPSGPEGGPAHGPGPAPRGGSDAPPPSVAPAP